MKLETNDDDKCYSECTGERKKELIQTDLDLVFKENLPDSVDSDPNFSLLSSWKELKTQFSKSDLFYLMNDHANIKYFNKNARYSHTTECIFNSVSSSASHSIDSPVLFEQKTNLILVFILLKIINEFNFRLPII